MNCILSALLAGVLMLPYCAVLAQGINPSPPQVIPPSPNAAALGKYGETPVGIYTGIPSVSIPIYQIQDGSLTLPISLNYHAGGVRVEEIAPWTGLGWTLNCGGVITRSVRGLPDDSSNRGYLNTSEPIPDISTKITSDPEFYNYATGGADGQPDLFYFNFAGRSGKFVFDREGDEVAIRSIPHQDLKITYVKGATHIVSFTVTAEDGTIYTFDEREFTNVTSWTRRAGSNGPTGGKSQTSFNQVNSWHLTSVSTPTSKQKITLEYATDPEPVSYELPGNETRYIFLYSSGLDQGNVSAFSSDVEDTETYTTFYIQNIRRLERVNFSQGYIKFTPSKSQRCDVEGDRYLKNISVFDKQNRAVKRFDLGYHYLSGNNLRSITSSCDFDSYDNSHLSRRLVLTSVQEYNKTDRKPPYRFEYDLVAPGLPSRFSKARDHWGYYNGKSNSTLVPDYVYYNPYYEPTIARSYNGADRSPSKSHAKAGSLTKITYPTGGSTEFSYELHEARGRLLIGAAKQVSRSSSFSIKPKNVVVGEETTSSVIEIKDKEGAFVDFYARNFPGGDSNYDLPFWIFIYRADASGNPVGDPILSINSSTFVNNWQSTGGDPGNKKMQKLLPNGRYVATHQALPSYHRKISQWYEYLIQDKEYIYPCAGASPCVPENPEDYTQEIRDIVTYYLEAKWKETLTDEDGNEDNDVYVGGLRVASIIDRDHNAEVTSARYYNYQKNGLSSGSITSIPLYSRDFLERRREVIDQLQATKSFNNHYLILEAQSQAPLSTTSGSYVGYSQVSVNHGENTENGSTTYHYTSPKSHPDLHQSADLNDQNGIVIQYIPFPYAPVDNRDWQRGLLLSETHYDTQGDMVAQTVNRYNHYDRLGKNNYSSVKGIKVGVAEVTSDNQFALSVDYFYTSSGYTELKESTTTQYNQNGSVTEKTTYQYGSDHLQRTQASVVSSKDQTYITNYQYATDFDGSTTYGSNLLRDNHMHSQVLEQTTTVEEENNAVTTQKVTTTYGNPSGNIVPTEVKNYPTGTGEAVSTDYDYDDQGNVRQVRGQDGVPTAFIWGYNQTLPVAKVVGATFSEVEAVLSDTFHAGSGPLSDTQVTDLRRELGNAQVTTYTHDPLVGITSETDPNGRRMIYHYDDLNRLQWIESEEGHVVQKFEYQYAEP